MRTLSIYGFLYNGYRFRTYYWEIIILYRKVIIVFILVFLGLISVQIQALVTLFVMMLSLILHINFQAFDKANLNGLETRAIVSASVTVYCGLYYLTTLDEGSKIAFFAIIVFANIYFIISWITVFAKEFTLKMRSKNQAKFDMLFKRFMPLQRILKYNKYKALPPARKYPGDI